VVENASEIAAINPCATGLAPDEIVGFVHWRTADALADIHAPRYRSTRELGVYGVTMV